MDSIKTKMQTHRFEGIYDCFKKSVAKEGVRGLFRGLPAPLLSTSATKAIRVIVYADMKPFSARLQQLTFGPLKQSVTSSKSYTALVMAINNAPVSFLSGAMSGAVCTAFASPFEFTKMFQQLIRMQPEYHSNKAQMPRTTWQVAQQIRAQSGVRGLFSGFGYHLMRDSLGFGLYFSLYETLKLLMDGAGTDEGLISGTFIPMSSVSITFAAAASGIMAWVLVFPIDTVKSLTQKDIISNIIRSLSFRPVNALPVRRLEIPTREMYHGLSVCILRSAIVSVAFFSTFEYLMMNIT